MEEGMAEEKRSCCNRARVIGGERLLLTSSFLISQAKTAAEIAGHPFFRSRECDSVGVE